MLQSPVSWPYETVESLNGNEVMRLKSSLFYESASLLLILGVALVVFGLQEPHYQDNGLLIVLSGVFSLLLVPFFLLYPLVRYLIGGKDSVVPVVATAVVEGWLMAKVANATRDKRGKHHS